MSADLGIKEFLSETGVAVQVAPRMIEVPAAVTAIPANPRERPLDGGFHDCELGAKAFSYPH